MPEPGQCSEAEALRLAGEHVAAMRGIAQLWAEDELVKRLDRAEPQIASAADLGASPLHDDSPQTRMHEMAADYFAELADPEHPGVVLEEALRSISADFMVRNHLGWPFVADASSLEEPFAPYFELWLRGVRVHFVGDYDWLVCLE